MIKKIVYDGNSVFKLNFGLYGFENINFEESKEQIEAAFRGEYEDQIKARLKAIGVNLEGWTYYSPNAYNHENDSLGITISIVDKTKLRCAIEVHEDTINSELAKNKSYDGYTALTVSKVKEELERLDTGLSGIGLPLEYEIDVLVLGVLLRLAVDFTGFVPYEYVMYEDDEEETDLKVVVE